MYKILLIKHKTLIGIVLVEIQKKDNYNNYLKQVELILILGELRLIL